ncbi:uroplakin-2 isoform X1 [Zalophus californianus]|uniref:Uroplakin-2 isoform X1 n=1 Tax=Zalophus californianus TaxID=9704 RepID=A0A6J2BNQ9_ZALCA|nr:uroplakin-2 isoform X1 [Zalophus californianus]
MASLLPVRTLPSILILLTVLALGASDFNISSVSGLLSPALTESLLVALPPCHLTGGNATLMVRRANDSQGLLLPPKMAPWSPETPTQDTTCTPSPAPAFLSTLLLGHPYSAALSPWGPQKTPLTSPPISRPVVKSSFVVPPCRGRRELVSVVDSGAGFTVTRLSAYQVTALLPGTKYYISYLVTKGTSTESSREIPMSTLPRRKVESIGLGMARTGGMVVITVLLSVAMFLLVLGFIIALALGAQK